MRSFRVKMFTLSKNNVENCVQMFEMRVLRKCYLKLMDQLHAFSFQ